MFPDGGSMGARIYCKTLDRLDVEVQVIDRMITMGGKIGPDVVFDRFRG